MTIKEAWQMEAEKAGGVALAEVIKEVRDTQRDILQRLDSLSRAFPAGDPDGHRRYHEAEIERMELRNRLVRVALEKVVQAGALAGCGWVAVAMWNYFKLSVHQ